MSLDTAGAGPIHAKVVTEDVWISPQSNVLQQQLAHDLQRLASSFSEYTADSSALRYVYGESACLIKGDDEILSPSTISLVKASLTELFDPSVGGDMVTSTPLVSFYTSHCFRQWAKDGVPEGYHYFIDISAVKTKGRISVASKRWNRTAEVSTIQVPAPRILIHKTTCEYKVDVQRASLNPARSLIFVEGYLW